MHPRDCGHTSGIFLVVGVENKVRVIKLVSKVASSDMFAEFKPCTMGGRVTGTEAPPLGSSKKKMGCAIARRHKQYSAGPIICEPEHIVSRTSLRVLYDCDGYCTSNLASVRRCDFSWFYFCFYSYSTFRIISQRTNTFTAWIIHNRWRSEISDQNQAATHLTLQSSSNSTSRAAVSLRLRTSTTYLTLTLLIEIRQV